MATPFCGRRWTTATGCIIPSSIATNAEIEMPYTGPRVTMKEGLAKLGALLSEAEKHRKFLSLHYGMSNRAIGLALQGSRITLDSFAEAALAAKRRLRSSALHKGGSHE